MIQPTRKRLPTPNIFQSPNLATKGSLSRLTFPPNGMGIPMATPGEAVNINRGDQWKEPLTTRGQKKCYLSPSGLVLTVPTKRNQAAQWHGEGGIPPQVDWLRRLSSSLLDGVEKLLLPTQHPQQKPMGAPAAPNEPNRSKKHLKDSKIKLSLESKSRKRAITCVLNLDNCLLNKRFK